MTVVGFSLILIASLGYLGVFLAEGVAVIYALFLFVASEMYQEISLGPFCGRLLELTNYEERKYLRTIKIRGCLVGILIGVYILYLWVQTTGYQFVS